MRMLSSSELVNLDVLLNQPGGKRLSVAEAVEMFGYRAIWVAALNGRVEEILRQRRLHGYPPRVFLSYRWEGPEHRRWVERVANAFRDAGYETLFDQYDCTVGTHMDVPAYVARIADCHIIVMIVTPDYLGSDTWVRDEINIAVTLHNQGLTRNIALVKSDVEGGLVFKLGCRPNDVLDLSDVDDPYDAVVRQFANRGPVYNEREQAQLKRLLDAVESLLNEQEYQEAAEQLNAYPEFNAAIEFNALAATLYAKVGQHEDALAIARDMLRSVYVDSKSRLRLAEVFRDCGEYRESLQTLLPLRGKNRESITAGYLFGLVLDDLGAYEAARNHLVNCRRHLPFTPALFNDLGVVYRNNGQLDEAEDCFRAVLDVRPNYLLSLANLASLLARQRRLPEADQFAKRGYQLSPKFDRFIEAVEQVPPPAFQRRPKPGQVELTCDHCTSSFTIDLKSERLCGGCGCVFDGSVFDPTPMNCPCCDNDAFVPVQVLELDLPVPMIVPCPVCLEGALVRGGPDEPSESAPRPLRESRTEAGELASLLDEKPAHPDVRLWFRGEGS